MVATLKGSEGAEEKKREVEENEGEILSASANHDRDRDRGRGVNNRSESLTPNSEELQIAKG